MEIVELTDFSIEVSPPAHGCYSLTDTLSAVSLIDTIDIVEWDWVITDGQGNQSVYDEPNPTISLSDTGLYDLELIATSEYGCTDTFSYENFYGVGVEIDVGFSASDTSICLLQPISFVDESSPLANGWHWDFGEGGVSNNANPTHEYGDYGIFTVVLTAFNNGCPSWRFQRN